MRRILYGLLLAGIILILLLPLLNIAPLFSPPAWGKTMAFRILFSGVLFLAAWLFLKKEIRLINPFSPKHPLFFPSIFLVGTWGIFLLSTLLSKDFYFSFWGTPERAWGFLNFSLYVLFAFLLLLFVKAKDWPKLWSAAVFTGVLVSVVALNQQLGFLGDAFVTQDGRSSGTLGNPISLGLYLLLLSIPALSFSFSSPLRKLFIAALPFLAIGIAASLSKSAFLGLGLGILYFLLFLPKSSLRMKIAGASLLLAGVSVLATVNLLVPEPPQALRDIRWTNTLWQRLSADTLIDETRLRGWGIEWQGILEEPFLGYGPYNSSIGFNKFYDPSVPFTTSGYWDTAHNYFLDILAGTGFPGLALYLLLLGALLFQLQKVKADVPYRAREAHGMQAALIGSQAALLFFPHTFSTYLISFLLVGYSLFLISLRKEVNPVSINISGFWRAGLLGLLAFALLWFSYTAAFFPLQVNKEVNRAEASIKNECGKALELLERLPSSGSFYDYYYRLKYIDIIAECNPQYPQSDLSKKAVEMLKTNLQIRPTEPRTWMLLGGFTNNLLANTQEKEERKQLAREAEEAFKKALELSPGRATALSEWVRTYQILSEQEKALEKTQECLMKDPLQASCWWQRALSFIRLGEFDAAQKTMEIARTVGGSSLENLLLQAVAALQETEETHYRELAELYEELVEFRPDNPQYRASLAFLYRELGEFDEARDEAFEVFKLNPTPETKKQVEDFWATLPE